MECDQQRKGAGGNRAVPCSITGGLNRCIASEGQCFPDKPILNFVKANFTIERTNHPPRAEAHGG